MINYQPFPYIGTEQLLVVGIDVGTTLSGVSYALLERGKVPRIQPLTRFSGQREENGKSEVRSVVYYDQGGDLIVAGPGTDPEVNPMLSDIEDVRRAECFQLRLWPTRLVADKKTQLEKVWPSPTPAEDEGENDVPLVIERVGGIEKEKEDPSREMVERQPLNERKIPRPDTDDFRTPVRAFTDFQCLFKSAKEYITETERNLDPTFTWSSIERNTYFVLTHPNGWEGRQQSQMRDAAVAVGLVNGSTAAHRIAFVTEGGAGLHFCLDKNPELHRECDNILVVDCGGGTINISAYPPTEKGSFTEIVSPDCPFHGPKAEQLADWSMSGLRQGSIFVTSRGRDYLNERHRDSHFESNDVVEVTTREYDVSGGKFNVEGAQQREEVAGFVKMLSAQIEQASSLMADSLSYRELPISSKELDDVVNGLASYLGSSLCNDLRRKSDNLNIGPDPLITQIVLQSGLVNACSYIINNGIPPSDGMTLSQTHGNMVGVGQTEADTWNGQPHTYTTTSLSERLEINRKYLAGIALMLITAVGGSLESEDVLPPQYNEVLEGIVEASLELRKVVNEDMPSLMELVTYTIPCDAEFDLSRMEGTEGDESETGSGSVICTMETGLQCRKREERGSGAEWHVAVKAKVVLASTLSSVLKGRK